jgi:hypothetical protein
MRGKGDVCQLFLPIALAFAFNVVAGVFEVFVDLAAVGLVADLEEHFDAYAAEGRKPHTTVKTWITLARFNGLEQGGEPPGGQHEQRA